MKVTLKDGYIENYALVGGLVDGIEVDDSSIENMEYFMENSSAYHIVDGKIELDSEKLKEIKNDIENKMLRKQREEECFPYINRGVLWYVKLNNEQKAELSVWYESWLDVTETKVIPEKPEWLDKF